MLASISFPILERIPLFGDAAISPHGIGIAVGFLLGALLMLRRAERRGVARHYVPDIRENVQQLLVRAAIGAVIGSRLFFVLTHANLYSDDPLSALQVWEGGLTFLGGVTGAVLVALPEMRRQRYDFWMLMDSATPGIALGLFIGRIGDLMIGDHIGNPAGDFPLGWECSGNYWNEATNGIAFQSPESYAPFANAAEPPTQGCFDAAVHQTALYDWLSAGVLLLVMLWAERRPRWNGFFVALFVYWYAPVRFLTDFTREDRTFFSLTGSQWALIAAVVAMTVYLWWRRPWRDALRAWSPPEFDLPWKQPPEDAERVETPDEETPRTGDADSGDDDSGDDDPEPSDLS